MGKYVIHRLDDNHAAIVAGLRKVGASVEPGGPLDVLVGFRGKTYLFEFKTVRGQLRASQKTFLETWRGHAIVIRTLDQALKEIGAL